MNIEDFIFNQEVDKSTALQGTFTWSAPSNIALVKYWGKIGDQIPANPSLSFTLSECKTITSLDYRVKSEKGISFDLLFEGKPKEDFKPKVQKFFERIVKYCPYIEDYHFAIDTKNTFPHSSGIASSASGMAALAVNVMSLEKALNPTMTTAYFDQKASFLARLGSGSACRSISGSIVVWGEQAEVSGSSNLYGVDFPYEVHPKFKSFCDVILLVDKGEKKVSSTVGHNLMNNHPYAEKRFEQAHVNLSELKKILIEGNINGFVSLVESEALTLHAMMMTSMPYFILMKPNTLQIIEKIWAFREKTAIPVCFTLDAGANVHVLFPKEDKDFVMTFIRQELALLCQNQQFIVDEIGFGAEQIK
ncbi:MULTISPECIES: diphosphomevalonate/mevalonate 3,5-bisphosphate decarboxylase family protein [Myroides]|uniref:Diphosphomevalonate decarboxylase n=1 Tax=Myroides albus TaxID=2562892 RepID=A0A6I3LLU5_9FLAO|nr:MULTISPECIES: diphosphomevalonate decarboxylase [Myroides]MTG96955.1 diphosphomevalonate decarboxylase [Myroides albus]MVX35352.1 diphosphomevalonate decarboxylase [Myroides sp. LoEW2-1]UVD78293.1 diphosphomevalonate decarboxylase [Myroides albus]